MLGAFLHLSRLRRWKIEFDVANPSTFESPARSMQNGVVPTRFRALTKVKHTMGPTKGLQGGKLVLTALGVARHGHRQVRASPALGVGRFRRRPP